MRLIPLRPSTPSQFSSWREKINREIQELESARQDAISARMNTILSLQNELDQLRGI